MSNFKLPTLHMDKDLWPRKLFVLAWKVKTLVHSLNSSQLVTFIDEWPILVPFPWKNIAASGALLTMIESKMCVICGGSQPLDMETKIILGTALFSEFGIYIQFLS